MPFRFERLQVWPKVLDFADRAINLSFKWPRGVQSSLGDQARRAAVSVVANIAEASGKRTGKSARALYDVAKASVYEVIGIMALARKRNLVDEPTFAALYRSGDEIAAMLWGLMQAVAEERGRDRGERGRGERRVER
jgi:four helix bundle protein